MSDSSLVAIAALDVHAHSAIRGNTARSLVVRRRHIDRHIPGAGQLAAIDLRSRFD